MTTPTKGPADFLELGDWNADCFICGTKRKASQMVKNWQGQYQCPHHVGVQRHPQDFVRGIPENMAAPWVQISPDNFVLGDFLITEQSPEMEPDYILTEDGSPITTES